MKKTVITVLISAFLIFGMAVADYALNGKFIPVNTSQITKKDLVSYITATGICKEQNKREIKVELPFEIEKVFVKPGDKISKGQKLLTLNKEPLSDKLMLQSMSTPSIDNSALTAKIENYDSEVSSPINGVVTEVYASDGGSVNSSLPLLVISDFDNLIIKASVSEEEITDIYEGQRVIIEGESLNKQIKGRVEKIYPSAKRMELTGGLSYITVDVRPDSFEGIIPETTLDLSFEKAGRKGSIVIPFGSVKFTEDAPFVFINNSGYAVKRQVNLGEEFDTEVEVTGGIYPGEELILNPGISDIKEGDKIITVNEDE